ncbi:hypothetical protein SAMN05443377_12325 [Propionibacterium cyclohexanicum]|uniref:Uncharacterized protein n=1 Tax=Propionibacterium cyclohexanicum TaxID=64702 RepID=A0A1H9TI42_9ACTN|nr:DLW-39 family protein [Propionibacterium cyclohexanicum]SER96654.1 hypothetical protein SAMN05443377_12325 [Propionibacterium cyclohexanicum]
MTKRLLSLLGISGVMIAAVIVHRHRELAHEAELWRAATDPID